MRPPLALRVLPPVAYRAWFTPPPLTTRAAGRDAVAIESLEASAPSPITRGDVTGLAAGSGPTVLALHGWGGRPAQMAGVIQRLASEGMHVVAPELPGHAGGPPTDIKEAAAAVESVVARLGPPRAVVAHSFAALALRLVDWREVPPALVMVAPAVKVSETLSVFSRRARLAPWVTGYVRRRLEAWDPAVFARVDDLAVDQFPGADLLILHDPQDESTSFPSAAELAALRSRTALVPVTGAGHNGVLGDPRALEEMATFLAARVAGSSSGRNP